MENISGYLLIGGLFVWAFAIFYASTMKRLEEWMQRWKNFYKEHLSLPVETNLFKIPWWTPMLGVTKKLLPIPISADVQEHQKILGKYLEELGFTRDRGAEAKRTKIHMVCGSLIILQLPLFFDEGAGVIKNLLPIERVLIEEEEHFLFLTSK